MRYHASSSKHYLLGGVDIFVSKIGGSSKWRKERLSRVCGEVTKSREEECSHAHLTYFSSKNHTCICAQHATVVYANPTSIYQRLGTNP